MHIDPFSVLSGVGLRRLFDDKWFLSKIKDNVAPNPIPAVERIRSRLGLETDFHGWEIPDHDEVSRYLSERYRKSKTPVSISLMAAHTHWDISRPIIYDYSRARKTYIVGNHQLIDAMEYYPVSFFFEDDTIFPYEWCAGPEVGLFPDLKYHYEAIADIFVSKVVNSNLFAIGLDFRFKFDQSISEGGSVEVPVFDDPVLADFSEIYDEETFKSKVFPPSGVEVVAWPVEVSASTTTTIENLLSQVKCIMREGKNLNEREAILAALFPDPPHGNV